MLKDFTLHLILNNTKTKRMKIKFIIVIIIFFFQYAFGQNSSNSGTWYDDLKFGLYYGNKNDLNINFSYTFFDEFEYDSKDLGYAIYAQPGLSNFKIGVEFVNRIHFWGLSHLAGQNLQIRLGFLKRHKEKSVNQNFVGIEIGNNLSIFGTKLGIYYNINKSNLFFFNWQFGLGY